MFEKVLVPTDFSIYSQKIVEFIPSIPGIKEVVLLHVVDATHYSAAGRQGITYNPEIEDARAQMELPVKYLEGKGLSAKAMISAIVGPASGPDGITLQAIQSQIKADMVVEGAMDLAIQAAADEQKVSLVIMGAHGKGLIRGIMLGSVSTDVLRYGRTDLLIMRHKMLEGMKGTDMDRFGPNLFSKVLVTTDLSPASDTALTMVKGLPGVESIALAHFLSKGETQEAIDRGITQASAKLREMRDDLERLGIKTTVHIDSGNPSQKIVALADKEDVSLIMIASQGKGRLEQIRVGSTTFDVARMANRPVLVVRTERKRSHT